MRVLRLRDGEDVTASDGAGSWRPCHLRIRVGADPVLEPAGPLVFEPAPDPKVTVAVALPKGERGDWAVQKLTEVGADAIVPLVTRRSVVRWGGEREGRGMERFARVARAAAMQARRVRLPELGTPIAVADLIGEAGRTSAGLCAAEPGGGPPRLDNPTVLVGPEGGWEPGELPDAAVVPRIGLGPNVLRTETAAVVAASALVMLRSFKGSGQGPGHGE